MPSNEKLKELKQAIDEVLPPECGLTKIEPEGPQIVIYLKNIRIFYEDDSLVTRLASKVRKKVLLRVDSSMLKDPELALKEIKGMVPEDAGIQNIRFDPEFNEVVIEALKPGLVIGKGGLMLKSIILSTGWSPRVLRSPTSPSEVERALRGALHAMAKDRKKFLHNLGKKMLEGNRGPTDWVKITGLGGFKEVGRSCVLLQTPNSNVLLDCGINADTSDSGNAYPYLNAMNLSLDQIDAVIVSHAHLDHCLHPDSWIQLSDGSIEKISEVSNEARVPAIDFDLSMRTDSVPAIQRGAIPAPKKMFTVRTKRNRLKVTGEHPFFLLSENGIILKQARDLREGEFIATVGSLSHIKGKKQALPVVAGMPKKAGEAVCQILGYLLGDATKMGGGYGTVCFTDKNERNLERYAQLLKKMGLNPKISIGERKRLKVHSIRFRKWVEKIESTALSKSVNRRIPNAMCKSPKKEVAAFLRGIFDAEGCVKDHSIVLSTSSEAIAHGVQLLLLRFGIRSHIYDHDESKSTFGGGPAFQIVVYSPESIKAFKKNVGFDDVNKQPKLEKICKKIGGGVGEKMDLVPINEATIVKLAERAGLSKQDLRRRDVHTHHYKIHKPSRKKTKQIIDLISREAKKNSKSIPELELLRNIVNSNIVWEPVTKIEKTKADCREVYDLTVCGHSNYFANGLIVHNCGFVPYLYKFGYEGPTYCTPPTRDLMILLQQDCINVMNSEGTGAPYGERDVKKELAHVITRNYGEVTDITPEIRFTFHNAGHILGSAITHLHIGEGAHNLVYTGDIKFGHTNLFEPADVRYPRVETLMIESTYGARGDAQPRLRDAEEELVRLIRQTVDKRGKVLIPVFAVGRAQEIMLFLEKYFKEGELTVYLDGMSREAAAIHTVYPEYLRRNVQRRILQNNSPFENEMFKNVVSKERKDIVESDEPCVILAPSGMLSGGPSVNFLKQMAVDERNALIFVGYQSTSSLGRRVQNGEREVPILTEGRKLDSLKINLTAHTVDGFSGHSDRSQLMAFCRHINPKPQRVLTMHGDENKALELARGVNKMLHVETRAIMNLDTVRLK